MDKIRAVPATKELIDQMRGRLRSADEIEVKAMSGRSADEAMDAGFDLSDMCWVAMYEDEPVCVFGVASRTLLSTTGAVWMLGTPAMEKIGRSIVRHSKEYIAKMLEKFELLENYVDTRNEISKRWLIWCGFTMESPVEYGLNGELFHRFFMKRG